MIFSKKIVKAYSDMMFVRCDDTGNVFYFSADDFEGLAREDFSFRSSKGHTLKGAFYKLMENRINAATPGSEEYHTLVKALKYGLSVLDEKNIIDFGEEEK